MRKLLWGALFAMAAVAVLGTALSARAMMIAPPPGPQRLAQSDVVIVGKVMAIEDKDIETTPAPGSLAKVTYRVAVVRVTEAVKGAQGKETIRVAWIAPQVPAPVGNPGGGPVLIRPGLRRPGITLAVGQDGLFYLTKHHQEDFLVAPAYFSFSSSQNANFNQEVDTARKTVKMLADPMPALKSTDARERLLAASLLVSRYRNRPAGNVRTEPIPAEESKLILAALADADWNQPFQFGQTSAIQVFNQLGLTAQDGWAPPQQVKTAQDYPNAAREWLRQNRDTYRLQRFVTESR
jgi:hypothetical protein